MIRFWDNDVLQQLDAVLESILLWIDKRTLTPTLLPVGERLKGNEP